MNIDILETLNNVKRLREERNLSQEQMADKMNITQSKYARFESGKTKTDLETLSIFCEKIGMTIKDFFLYPDKIDSQKEVRAIIQIELKNQQKESILKQLIGKQDLELLNETN